MELRVGDMFESLVGDTRKITNIENDQVSYLYNGTSFVCISINEFKNKVKHDRKFESIKSEEKSSQGERYNQGKLRWRNFPMFLMEPLIEVAQYGEQKYDTFNFLKGQTILDSLDSLKRHLNSFENPYEPDEDKESKVNHLAHVAWNALVALHMMKTRSDLDDRYKLSEESLRDYAEEIQKRGR